MWATVFLRFLHISILAIPPDCSLCRVYWSTSNRSFPSYFYLCFKMTLGAQPFIEKWDFAACAPELISKQKKNVTQNWLIEVNKKRNRQQSASQPYLDANWSLSAQRCHTLSCLEIINFWILELSLRRTWMNFKTYTNLLYVSPAIWCHSSHYKNTKCPCSWKLCHITTKHWEHGTTKKNHKSVTRSVLLEAKKKKKKQNKTWKMNTY